MKQTRFGACAGRLVGVVLLVSLASGCAVAAPVIYTGDNPPKTPALDDLELSDAVSQHGITWTFDAKAPVGRFVNGDWYVVGPVSVTKIDPAPVYGADGRNGSMLNIPALDAASKPLRYVGFDGRIRHHRYKAELMARLPIEMKPGDSLVSTISLAEIEKTVEKDGKQVTVRQAEKVRRMMRGWSSTEKPTRTAAVLTCMASPQPPDAFRPAYSDRQNRVYLARNLRRDLLPRVAGVESTPKLTDWVRMFERPWIDVLHFTNSAPIRNMPMYGREVGRAVGIGALMLCLDWPAEEKETLIVNYVQVGIDYWGLARDGLMEWHAHGGHHIGRKLPVVVAGSLLGDAEMACPTKSRPACKFQEDMQTMYGDGWTGARVVYAGHVGAEGAKGRKGWGAYEHLHPSKWEEHGGRDFMLGESYRRCCTSHSWIGQALALRLMDVEAAWDHEAFFDYCDRWMHEDDTEFIKVIQKATGKGEDYAKSWAKQGSTWDPFVNEMWAKYRPALQPPPDGWKKEKGPK